MNTLVEAGFHKESLRWKCPHFAPLEQAILLPNASIHTREKALAMDACMKACGLVKSACAELVHGVALD